MNVIAIILIIVLAGISVYLLIDTIVTIIKRNKARRKEKVESKVDDNANK